MARGFEFGGRRSAPICELKMQNKAADAAREIIERFGTNDPFEIAEKADVTIVYESWYPTTIGEFERKTRRILVNTRALEDNKNHETLKRAIVAHELAHFFAAEFKIKKLDEERFAHEFAKELLK